MQAQIEKKPTLGEIPRAQRRALSQALPDFERRYERNEAIARAYLSGQHTMAAIAQHFGVHYTTVSRLVSAYEESVGG
jgi:transposase-like protein